MENNHRGGSRTAAISKMERFAIIVNGFQPLTIITKRSILNVAAVLYPLLSRKNNAQRSIQGACGLFKIKLFAKVFC